MFGFDRILKTHKPRSFNHQPRYYNERKERLDKLKSKFNENGEHLDKRFYREHLQESWRRAKPKKDNKQSLRMIVVLVILILVIYYMFDFDFLKAFNGK